MSRCGCYGSTGVKNAYASVQEARAAGDATEERHTLRHSQHERTADPLVLWVYPCPRGNGYHLTRMAPEEQEALELRRKRSWEERQERPELPYTPLSKLMWDVTLLATRLRGEEPLSRSDLVELVYAPAIGWQASAPVKPTGKRYRWVRVTGSTAEYAVQDLIRRLTRMAESPDASS